MAYAAKLIAKEDRMISRVATLSPFASPYALQANMGKQAVRISMPLQSVIEKGRKMSVVLRRKGDKQSIEMNDAGARGDFVAMDGIYSATVQIETSKVRANTCWFYEVQIKMGRLSAVSRPLRFCVSSFPVRVAASNIEKPAILDDGIQVVADEVLVYAKPETGSAVILELARSIDAAVVGTLPPLYLYQLKLPFPVNGQRLQEIIARINLRSDIAGAAPNLLGRPSGHVDNTTDPEFGSQNGVKLVLKHPTLANNYVWDAGAIGTGETIVVADYGLDRTHPDFGVPGDCQLSLEPALGVGNTDCGGTNNDSAAAGVYQWHGTRVAGIIAAKAYNAQGIAGVAHGSKIYSHKVASFALADMDQIFIDATGHGAGVINASFTGGPWNPAGAGYMLNINALCSAVDAAVSGSAIVVAAAGNTPETSPGSGVLQNPDNWYYPARCNEHANVALPNRARIIAVGNSTSVVTANCGSVAIDQLCAPAVPFDANLPGSNYGAWVDIVAPGSNIRTTTSGGYTSSTGTSFSTPIVSGAVAILKGCGVALDSIKSTLIASSIVDVPYPNSSAPLGTTPRLDVYQALQSVNQTPTTINISNSSLNENINTAAGVLVGNLTTVSTDTCDKYTYSIFGGADAAVFSIGGANGDQLRIAAGVLDFETKPTYTVIVRVTDFFGAVRNRTFTINVTDLNEAPTAVVLSNTVPSTPENGGSVKVADISVTDDALGTNVLSLAGVDAASFSLVGNALNFNGGANFEVKSTYNVTVRVNDAAVGGNPDATQAFALTITDVNEAPTAVVLSNTVPSTPENGGSVKVADISVTDDALGTNVLSLAGVDAASFSLVGNALNFNGGANFEVKSTYNVTVRVNDAAVGGNPDATQAFTLNITNVNEAPVVANQVFTVNEGSSSGYVLGSVVASDPDTGASLTYSITGLNPGGFGIGTSSGQVAVGAVAMDFEATPVYTFTVQVSDGSLSATADITVNVINVNEPPTAVSFANVVSATPENGGSVKVADIIVTDDALGTNVLSVPAGPFSVVGNALYFNGGADFETLPVYSVVVSVDDISVGATPDASQTFNLAITDVNEAPNSLSLVNTVTSTPENGGNLKVADIVVTDDALGTNALSVNSPSFSIVGSSLYFNGGADYETLTSYNVTVSVDDAAVGATPDASQSLTLTITDVNEAPTAVQFSNVVSATPENGGDIKVADIAITDDALGVNTLLLSGTDPGMFSLVGNELHFNGSADFETKSSFSVTVDVNDLAVGGAVDASQTFSLAITNANEQPSIANQSFNHVEYWSGTPFDPFIGIVAANDPDAGDTLTFTITSGNEATVAGGVVQSNAFAFDPATPGRLVANNTAALNFEYKPVFNLGVQVTDAGGLSSTAVVTVNLGDDATDNGDPHINTVDRLHYDFQSAGEFVALRGKNGMEIQVRQTPVSTATPLTDPLSGLTSGVSVNTALAMRVGKHRVTYQAENGAPVLRVDGAVTTLPTDGVDLGDGGRVLPQGGGIKVDFPDGTTLLATASPWAYYNVWWVNFSVHHTTAREGIMGARKNGSWLPRLSDGSAFGAMPAAMHDRYVELYVKFADSWRVNEKTSLFDYAEGTSTATYTNKDWPTESGPYVADSKPPVKALPRKDAQLACRGVLGKVEQADCVFDVMVMGHKDIAKGHLVNQKLRLGATDVLLREFDVLTKRREKVFIATVARVAAAPLLDRKAKLTPTGSVQFLLEGKPLGNPVKLDTKGQARVVLPVLKLGKGAVTARFIPIKGGVLLPSISKQPIRALRPIEPVLIRGIR
jgi:hypothetical protein